VKTSAEIWRDFDLDENCVALLGEDKTRVYLSQIRRALLALGENLKSQESVTESERNAVARYLERLAGTYEVLGLRHFFAESAELKIDTTDSGFVHFSTLLALAADIAARDAKLSALGGVAEIKRAMLAQIVDHGAHPRRLQVELMQRLYLESLSAEKTVSSFGPGRLERVGQSNNYFWSFSTYDRALNRPFVYLLYFSYAGASGNEDDLREDSDAFSEIRGVAESGALGRIGLLGFANDLDYKIDRVCPKIVKRLVIGPYWAPQLTTTEGEIGELLESFADRLPFAMRWETETLLSERETQVGAGWFSKGRTRQVFWIPKDHELSARGVSQVSRYLLVPDWLARQIDATGALSDHRCIAIAQSEAA
jgi:hypothetical protein